MAGFTDSLAAEMTYMLDALDEYSKQWLFTLVEGLQDFYFSRRMLLSASQVKFLSTSRAFFDIKCGFNELLRFSNNIKLAGNDKSESIKQEIDLIIKHHVARTQQGKLLTTQVENKGMEGEERDKISGIQRCTQ